MTDPIENRSSTASWWNPEADASVSPDTDTVHIDGVVIGKGSRVVLVPGSRRTDAQDMFLRNRPATVRGVFVDVGGDRFLAVTLDEDPAADLQETNGRFRYFRTDEVRPWTPGSVGEVP
jgi:hypothetical protein